MVISIFLLALKGEATIFVVLKELAKKMKLDKHNVYIQIIALNAICKFKILLFDIKSILKTDLQECPLSEL